MNTHVLSRQIFRNAIFLVLFVALGCWWVFHIRELTFVIMIAFFVMGHGFRLGYRPFRSVILVWLVAVLTTLLPFDMRLWPAFRSPRFVPIVYGFPNDEAMKKAEQGEVVLGGCMPSEPKWMLVW